MAKKIQNDSSQLLSRLYLLQVNRLRAMLQQSPLENVEALKHLLTECDPSTEEEQSVLALSEGEQAVAKEVIQSYWSIISDKAAEKKPQRRGLIKGSSRHNNIRQEIVKMLERSAQVVKTENETISREPLSYQNDTYSTKNEGDPYVSGLNKEQRTEQLGNTTLRKYSYGNDMAITVTSSQLGPASYTEDKDRDIEQIKQVTKLIDHGIDNSNNLLIRPENSKKYFTFRLQGSVGRAIFDSEHSTFQAKKRAVDTHNQSATNEDEKITSINWSLNVNKWTAERIFTGGHDVDIGNEIVTIYQASIETLKHNIKGVDFKNSMDITQQHISKLLDPENGDQGFKDALKANPKLIRLTQSLAGMEKSYENLTNTMFIGNFMYKIGQYFSKTSAVKTLGVERKADDYYITPLKIAARSLLSIIYLPSSIFNGIYHASNYCFNIENLKASNLLTYAQMQDALSTFTVVHNHCKSGKDRTLVGEIFTHAKRSGEKKIIVL